MKVLIAEDSKESQLILRAILKDFEVVVCDNGVKALEEYSKDEYGVILTDITMPEMDGMELVKNIRALNQTIPILVLSASQKPEIIVEIMRSGANDYIMKPFVAEEIQLKIKNTVEYANLLKLKEDMGNRGSSLNDQLGLILQKKLLIEKQTTKFDKKLFYSLHTSFSQGSGFGGLVALIDMLSSSPKEDNGSINISSEMLSMLLQNGKAAQRVLDYFARLNSMLENGIQLEAMNIDDFLDLLQKTADDTRLLQSIGRHQIILSKKTNFKDGNVRINENHFKESIKELLINCFKFSEQGSIISIVIGGNAHLLKISMVSDPLSKGEVLGVPPDYEPLVFEPFFRLSSFVKEEYGTMDFGLGLTYVRKVFQLHSGQISMKNIAFFTDEAGVRLMTEITIPVY